jgi:hypothetical protein
MESPLQSTTNGVGKNDSQVAVLPQQTQSIQSEASLGITTRSEEQDFVRMQKLRSSPQQTLRLLSSSHGEPLIQPSSTILPTQGFQQKFLEPRMQKLYLKR